MTVRLEVEVRGVVQGVGFRPAVARIALRRGLSGTVSNESGLVRCEFEGSADAVSGAVDEVSAGPTPLSRIDSVRTRTLPCRHDHGFRIATSRTGGTGHTLIPADVACCAACLAEMRDPGNRRHRHPFITCTDCGPRYTVITDLPYDRAATTMAHFAMCRDCRAEYENPLDRRFHAETIACPHCGPQLEFRRVDGARFVGATVTDPIEAAAQALHDGQIVAIKGIGGFHLACRADRHEPVATLRGRKHRPDKPLAVMAADLDHAAMLIELTTVTCAALVSPQAPIVVVPRVGAVAPAVAPRLGELGVLLAYSPVHHLLFDAMGAIPLVMTSANTSGSPILYCDDDIDDRLAGIADAVLTHDRPIHVPCEDSVIRIAGDGPVPVRRSRGYAPMPVPAADAPMPIVATGGDLKTTFCLLATHDGGHLSSHLGDFADPRTQRSFTDALDHLQTMTGISAGAIACDMHPGYATTSWARRHAAGRPVVEVQHHHAHAVSLLAEHRLLGTPALVWCCDGTGYGTDGTIWGGELLALGPDISTFTRVAHLAEFALPGGDNAVRDPSRIALDLLWRSGITDIDDLAPARTLGDVACRILVQQRRSGVGCPVTTSLGRLFDAVAALLGICVHPTYEGQAAVELETVARTGTAASFAPASFAPAGPEPDDGIIDYRHLIAGLVDGLRAGRPTADLAASFQHWVIGALVTRCVRSARALDIGIVGLSGGVFVNNALRQGVTDGVEQAGLRALTHHVVPAGDGGLALGQACIAAATLRSGPAIERPVQTDIPGVVGASGRATRRAE